VAPESNSDRVIRELIERLTRVETLEEERFRRLQGEIGELRESFNAMSSKIDRALEKVSTNYVTKVDFWKIIGLAILAGSGSGGGVTLALRLLGG